MLMMRSKKNFPIQKIRYTYYVCRIFFSPFFNKPLDKTDVQLPLKMLIIVDRHPSVH